MEHLIAILFTLIFTLYTPMCDVDFTLWTLILHRFEGSLVNYMAILNSYFDMY